MSIIRQTITNPALCYAMSRYATYGIQFINSLFIALYLGPVYLGIWGFVNLIVQYLSQINLGISHAVNTIAAINKRKVRYISYVLGNSVSVLLIFSSIIGLLFFISHYFHLDFGEKYQFSKYSFLVLVIGVFAYFNNLFANIFRIYGRILEMALSQSMLPLATSIVLFLYRGEALLQAMVWAYVITSSISLLLFTTRLPIPVQLNFNKSLWLFIQKKGLHLFLYNTSFYLIIISTRSFISAYYKVEEFGLFTFAFSLASIMSLLLDSFTFLLWPKLINRLSTADHDANYQLLQKMRDIYVTATHALMHLGIFIFPFFLLLFPGYRSSFGTFALIILTTSLFANSFGYQGLLIAKGKEREIGILAFCCLLINVLLCLVSIKILQLSYDKVILATLITYAFYIVMLCISGRKILHKSAGFGAVWKDIAPLPIIIPFLLSLIFIVIQANPWLFILPLLLYFLLNYSKIALFRTNISELIKNPKTLEI